MTDLEQRVGEAFRRRADRMEIPVPHVDRLVSSGEATIIRRRRRGLIAAAAVVAVLALGPWLFLRSGTSSGPARPPAPTHAPTSTPDTSRALDDLPQGPAPTVPYLLDGSLHVDGSAIRTDANRVLAAGGTVLVGRTGERQAHWWLFTGTDLVPVAELDGVFTPSLSPRGDLLAWTSYPDSRTTRVTAWDPARQREVDHVDLDAPYAACCGGGQEVEIYGIDLHDQVYWTQKDGYQVWHPGAGSPQRLTGLQAMHEVAPDGPVEQGGALGRVDDRGHWSKLRDLPSDQGLTWSSDGSLMAYAGDDTGAVLFKQAPTDQWVLDPASLRRVHLEVPGGARGGVIGFESDAAVLVDAFVNPRQHYVLRCSTTDGACERTLPTGRPRWTFPEYGPF